MIFKPFLLASGSPQRKWILSQLGLHFKVIPANVDENLNKLKLKSIPAIVKRLALMKAQVIAKKFPHQSVLGADTLVLSREGKILEKPKNKKEAQQMLKSYNGAYCDVYSGVAWLEPGKKDFVAYEKTRIHFKTLSQAQLNNYLKNDDWKYCSGALKIEEVGDWLRRMEGDYWNVVGLPVNSLKKFYRKK